MKSRPIASVALVLLAAVAALISACGDSGVRLTNASIPGAAVKGASIDVIEIDQGAHLLYAADRTDQGVDVFDISRPQAKYIRTIGMPGNPNGLAIAPDLGRLFVGTDAGSVVIVNISTTSTTYGAVIAEVKTGNSVDLVDYGAARQRVYAASAGSVISIDPTTGQVVTRFTLGAVSLEQPRFDPADGMLYVTSPDADTLYRIDPSTGTLTNKYLLGGCEPLGLAINPNTNKALMACHKYTLAFDLSAGKIIGTFPLGNADIVSYDSKVDRFLVASLPHAQTPGSVGIFGGNPIEYISSAVTNISGNSAAYDETNNVVYTPDIEPARASLASFAMPAPLTGWLASANVAWPYAAIVLGILLLFAFLIRMADPMRRPVPAPKRVSKKATRNTTDRPQQA
ncbi:MAG TPA: PQQ-binding-like beta-propeller repeat protein [Candidatus Micrarchaeaceae archaeon]|nr:PQQ-binding-like beta-propeller repeat protein [Candidatus Micrarchaeaceae archaeon]